MLLVCTNSMETNNNIFNNSFYFQGTTKALWNARLKLLRSIIGAADKRPRPVVVILAGHEEGCEIFLKYAMDMNWGIIVIPGTGGQADALHHAMNGEGDETNKIISNIAENGNVTIFPNECGHNEMRTLCRSHLMLSGLAELMLEIDPED